MGDKYDKVAMFGWLRTGEEFIETLSPVNEVASRTEDIVVKTKRTNAKRSGGIRIWMSPWEPVFVTKKVYELMRTRAEAAV